MITIVNMTMVTIILLLIIVVIVVVIVVVLVVVVVVVVVIILIMIIMTNPQQFAVGQGPEVGARQAPLAPLRGRGRREAGINNSYH